MALLLPLGARLVSWILLSVPSSSGMALLHADDACTPDTRFVFQFPLHREWLCYNQRVMIDQLRYYPTFSSLFIGNGSVTINDINVDLVTLYLSVPSSSGMALLPVNPDHATGGHLYFQFPLHREWLCYLQKEQEDVVLDNLSVPSSSGMALLLPFSTELRYLRLLLSVPSSSGMALLPKPMIIGVDSGLSFQFPLHREWLCYFIGITELPVFFFLSVPSSSGMALLRYQGSGGQEAAADLSVPSSSGMALLRRFIYLWKWECVLSVPSSSGMALLQEIKGAIPRRSWAFSSLFIGNGSVTTHRSRGVA